MQFFTFRSPAMRLLALATALAAIWPTCSRAQTAANAECACALAGPGPLSPALIAGCSDERTAAIVQQLLDGQRKQAASATSSGASATAMPAGLPAWLQEAILKRQIPELSQAVKGLREQGVADGATLSERQAAVALFQGDATSAVDVLESMLIVKKQVPLTLRRQGVLLRTHDAGRAARVLELAVAQSPDDFDLLQQAADSQLVLGQFAGAQKWQQQMLALATAAVAKTGAGNDGRARAAQHRLASAERELGNTAQLLNKKTDAQQHYARAQAIWQGMLQQEAGEGNWQTCWQNELAGIRQADAASRQAR